MDYMHSGKTKICHINNLTFRTGSQSRITGSRAIQTHLSHVINKETLSAVDYLLFQ